MNGVIVIDKPAGFTSFDVIAVVRRLTGQRKTGHTGTLDPNATGVLPVLLGSATKAQDLIPNHDKSYVTDFRLGLTSDTLDIWGELSERQETDVAEEELLAALAAWRVAKKGAPCECGGSRKACSRKGGCSCCDCGED